MTAMQSAVQVVVSGGISLGVPLLVALHEWRAIRRNRGGDDDGRRRPPDPPPDPSRGGNGALPTCLIPTEQWRAPTRGRELARERA